MRREALDAEREIERSVYVNARSRCFWDEDASAQYFIPFVQCCCQKFGLLSVWYSVQKN